MYKILLSTSLVAALAGCGASIGASSSGGGSTGGSTGGSPYTTGNIPATSPTAFTSYSAAPSTGNVALTGTAITGGNSGSWSGTSTLTVSRTNGEISGLQVSNNGNTIVEGQNAKIEQQGVYKAAINDGNGSGIIVSDPKKTGDNYQTYGTWYSNQTSTRFGDVGVGSYGSKTPASAMPTTGTASYSGYSVGAYDSGTTGYNSKSKVTVTTSDFKNVQLKTSNTQIISATSDTPTNRPDLDLTGTGTISSNGFSGTVTNSAGLTGTMSGSFYGPNANEVGGTLSASNGTASYGAAFGGKQ